MPYSVPSLDDLSKRARQLFALALPGAKVDLWPSTHAVVGKVVASIGFEVHLRIDWLLRQVFASTADDEWLDRHGYELGVTRVEARRAIGDVLIVTTGSASFPAGLLFQRGDGALFRGRVSGVCGGTVALSVEAVDPGPAGNTDPGATLTPLDATPGFPASGTVNPAGLSGGADRETKERFRARVLTRKRKPSQGGARSDYAAWAAEALPTVRGVWVDSFVNDTRSVWVAFTVGDQPNGIPTPSQVAIVQAYLDDPIRRPVTARVFVVAPLPVIIPVVIARLSPDTPDTRSNAEAELAAVFAARARPSSPSQPFTLEYDWLDEAISGAVGEDSHDLVTPSGDIPFPVGYMPALGAVSYPA